MIITSNQMIPWLEGRRWFGGKGARIASVRELDRAEVSQDLLILTLEVSYLEGRARERYLAPLRPSSAGGFSEALDDDDAARALLEIIRAERRFKTAMGQVWGERFDSGGSPLDALGAEPAVRRLSAEQSNTSLVFDDSVIVKLIRKLLPGVNPELEVGAFLARHGYRATPQLLGAVSVQGALEATIAVAHRFVRVDSDGWSYVLDSLKQGAASSGSLLKECNELGARVGELHAVLASDSSDPAFAPEPIRAEDLERWTAAILADLDKTCAAAAAAVPGLASRKPALQARIERLLALSPSGVRIRQHGDLHLGQVLRSDGQWMIFDFEGEPARSLGERRARHCPLKDVAGMVRSFAYATATVELEGGGGSERLARVREAFLAGYRSTAADLLPDSAEDARVILDALELEKLLYELRYELGHRPDWVRIPARDLLAEPR